MVKSNQDGGGHGVEPCQSLSCVEKAAARHARAKRFFVLQQMVKGATALSQGAFIDGHMLGGWGFVIATSLGAQGVSYAGRTFVSAESLGAIRTLFEDIRFTGIAGANFLLDEHERSSMIDPCTRMNRCVARQGSQLPAWHAALPAATVRGSARPCG
ncbi:hypothetical protein T492DRAFT_1022866 [Pavlovales sp. CCMP2436]|nr:hypothetical protein T492DRAFT_1022866 [Pavlovales sp. CCMP2436]